MYKYKLKTQEDVQFLIKTNTFRIFSVLSSIYDKLYMSTITNENILANKFPIIN